jgi:hypothetical protein
MQMLEYQLKKLDGEIIQQDFAGQVKVVVSLPLVHLKTLQAMFS